MAHVSQSEIKTLGLRMQSSRNNLIAQYGDKNQW